MIEKMYYYLIRKYCEWTDMEHQKFPGHRILKDIRWTLQTIFKGYNDFDLWNLSYHLAEIILKRLEEFKKMKRVGFPCKISEEKWEEILDEMIEGFRCQVVERDGDLCSTLEEQVQLQKKVDRGLKLFSKYFQDLWD